MDTGSGCTTIAAVGMSGLTFGDESSPTTKLRMHFVSTFRNWTRVNAPERPAGTYNANTRIIVIVPGLVYILPEANYEISAFS